MSPRTAGIVLAVGIVLGVAGLAAYAAAVLLSFLTPDDRSVGWIIPAVILLLLSIAAVGSADLARRSTAPPATRLRPSAGLRRVSLYRVRPLAWPWHLLWLVVLLAAWFVVLPLPMSSGWLAHAENPTGAQVACWLGALVLSFFVGMVLVSLIKKLVTPRMVRRHPGVVPRQGALRAVLYVGRADLYFGGAGALLAGIAVGPGLTGYADAAVLLLAPGGILLAVGIVLAVNFWRTGETLGNALLAEPSGVGGM